MAGLRILLLSDDRPGHYHLAEGVVAAIERLAEVELTRLSIRRRGFIPSRYLRAKLAGNMDARRLLRLGYGINADALAPADVVISAGGETIVANIAATRHLGASNIFCGSLRKVAPENFSAVVSSYERHRDLARHIVTLKPNTIDPDSIGRPKQVPTFNAERPPAMIGLLIGGDSGLFRYQTDEWRRLIAFMGEVSAAWGSRWLVSTSRRTSRQAGILFAEIARDTSVVAEFIDYSMAGPGTLTQIFSRSDAIVCTEDSSSMISEAICARQPVIGVSPADHAFKPEEAEYRQYMLANNWCRLLAISGLSVPRFGDALSEVRPLDYNHLDRLAERLRQHLPALFEDG